MKKVTHLPHFRKFVTREEKTRMYDIIRNRPIYLFPLQ